MESRNSEIVTREHFALLFLDFKEIVSVFCFVLLSFVKWMKDYEGMIYMLYGGVGVMLIKICLGLALRVESSRGMEGFCLRTILIVFIDVEISRVIACFCPLWTNLDKN